MRSHEIELKSIIYFNDLVQRHCIVVYKNQKDVVCTMLDRHNQTTDVTVTCSPKDIKPAKAFKEGVV